MSEVWEFLKQLTNPESIINYGGLLLLLFVVFAETGLFIGFFLPGDSLLFTSGLLCGMHIFNTSIFLLIFTLCLAAIIGNMTGFIFGYKAGEALFSKKDSLIFKQKYLQMTRDFYARHGGKTIIIGRFLPIVRTFAPILAGAIKIDFKKFFFYNVVGSVLWVFSLTLTGYFLGMKYPHAKNYLGTIVIAMILVTSIPILKKAFKK
ncbi:MAG: VTT domain-containing protein [Bacteroidia bacterium]